MTITPDESVKLLAQRLLETEDYESIPARERHVIERIAKRVVVARDLGEAHQQDRTFGQRLADRVAAFGGSWTFIGLFALSIFVWVVLNTWLLTRPFDPFPYILLNLFLSLVAAIQAPIIMMSQNRQAAKDRLQATHDYEVNLKAEIEIMALHEKLDEMRDKDIAALVRSINGRSLK
ncbi:MAG: DUF1003 domain-containing protein [Hyphomicrobiales bacterium]